MSDKGDVYYCTWTRLPDGRFVGWEKRRPSLRAEASSAVELIDFLGEVIGEHYNDHEAALIFDPCVEINEAHRHLFVSDLVTIGWNASYSFRPSASSAFNGGRCNYCGGGLGPRTSLPLTVDSFDGRSDGAVSQGSNEPPPAGMPGRLMILSEAFVNQLTNDERAAFGVRPVLFQEAHRQTFYEVMPKELIPAVAIRGMKVTGWQCPRCSQRSFGHGMDLGWGTHVVSRSDLELIRSTLFFIGTPTDFHAVIPRSRWEALYGKAETRKLGCSPLASVDEDQCDRVPPLRALTHT